ncbi:Hpt domain-containing protein [Saccharicrinis carchari]|uniref:Hpt domain-containing protein n=1 Tax=Saccharicrinis carchari TaxID=1168039 RepID=A0A521CEX0_SACCC|nr:Hpt domain-containing protein [Saccharicrinis carchari]SMO57974.1 Hpt domain-containing protein [Saccharicrinis carchari]
MIQVIKEKFIADTLQSLCEIEKCLSNYSEGCKTEDLVEDVFMVLHQIKGTAPMLGIKGLSEIVYPAERVYIALRQRELSFSHEIKLNTIQLITAIKAILAVNQEDNLDSKSTPCSFNFFESLVN